MNDLRNQIDAIDLAILHQLAKRFELSKTIGQFKRSRKLPIQDKEREASMIDTLINKGKELGLSKSFINELFPIILKESRRIQSAQK